MKIVSVVGTRPQLIKAAALQPALRARHADVFVDTGQHYDEAMAGSFFGELGLAAPDHALGVGSGSHAEQTGAMLRGLEPVLIAEAPDVVLVFGDTNSTLAGALVAAKLTIPVAHVEAGLRSFDRRMPEEVNRVVVDHLARWRFAPTATAMHNLAAEGIVDGAELVGDLMQDIAARVAGDVRDPTILDQVAAGMRDDGESKGGDAHDLRPGGYCYATIHRAENREPDAIGRWVALFRAVARPDRPVVVALHPGTRVALERAAADVGPHVVLAGPLGYRSSLALQLHAAAVLTDSGGIQREAAWLAVPCLVLRTTTEWAEALADSAGRMVVVGLDATKAVAALDEVAPLAGAPAAARKRARELDLQPAGAAERIAAALDRAGVPA